ncbi:integrator complex subunit 6 homolog [Musca vetustissima]|uniref:integrator complex subunit 6 homolog n=1 Tax=Musca vetustissima TaxID=27455 RepID=UPI002AB64494|nr:integrator complex subunit 6 homolog [Musca vetustissima]
MASRNSKNSGMRLLWIPGGGRKGHTKGRFDSTNKRISYSTRQKKSEVWSLGGSKAQNELLNAEPDVSLLDGPSTSGIASIACATAVGSSAAVIAKNSTSTFPSNEGATAAAECLTDASTSDSSQQQQQDNNNQTSPTTPNSTASTAQLISPPLSPLIHTDQFEQIDSDTESSNMPAKSHQPIPVIVTTTTTAQIMDENRYSILGKDITTNEFDIYTLPSPPNKDATHNSIENLNSSSGTTASQKSPSGSPIHKKESIITTTAITNESHNANNHAPQQQEQNGSVNSSPIKKKHHHRNHNNNQGDVNSIESITEDTTSDKIPSADLDWIDSAIQDRNDRVFLTKTKKKKKNKLAAKGKGLDQLDGVPAATKEDTKSEAAEDDEKVVKCLYYTLMCCDCTLQ